MSTRLEGKVAFVTGAASGIGRAQAIRFAEEGASVIVADLTEQGVNAVVAEITASGGSALGVVVDISDEASVKRGVDAAIAKFGRITTLCNTAGVFDQLVQTLDTPREVWDKVVAVNLTGLYLMTNAVLPHLIENGGGVVLNMASAAGLRGGGGGAAYTTTKHGIVGYTRQLAAAYRAQKVRAVAIAPGAVDTPMIAAILQLSAQAQDLASSASGSRIAQPEDIAAASAFLVSDEATFINGIVLPIDSGMDAILQ
jgi:3-oxoacyl-[acyl-carrier protein] reductase